jgi:hypothetical protein
VAGLHGGGRGVAKESKKDDKLNRIKVKLQNRCQDKIIQN